MAIHMERAEVELALQMSIAAEEERKQQEIEE
jgi:hypothetical protein